MIKELFEGVEIEIPLIEKNLVLEEDKSLPLDPNMPDKVQSIVDNFMKEGYKIKQLSIENAKVIQVAFSSNKKFMLDYTNYDSTGFIDIKPEQSTKWGKLFVRGVKLMTIVSIIISIIRMDVKGFVANTLRYKLLPYT